MYHKPPRPEVALAYLHRLVADLQPSFHDRLVICTDRLTQPNGDFTDCWSLRCRHPTKLLGAIPWHTDEDIALLVVEPAPLALFQIYYSYAHTFPIIQQRLQACLQELGLSSSGGFASAS